MPRLSRLLFPRESGVWSQDILDLPCSICHQGWGLLGQPTERDQVQMRTLELASDHSRRGNSLWSAAPSTCMREGRGQNWQREMLNTIQNSKTWPMHRGLASWMLFSSCFKWSGGVKPLYPHFLKSSAAGSPLSKWNMGSTALSTEKKTKGPPSQDLPSSNMPGANTVSSLLLPLRLCHIFQKINSISLHKHKSKNQLLWKGKEYEAVLPDPTSMSNRKMSAGVSTGVQVGWMVLEAPLQH